MWPITITEEEEEEDVTLHVDFLTSFYCDVTIVVQFDGPFDCDIIIKILPTGQCQTLYERSIIYLITINRNL